MKGVYDMEIIYYIIDDGERVRVDKSMYDNWNGEKYIKSGFTNFNIISILLTFIIYIYFQKFDVIK